MTPLFKALRSLGEKIAGRYYEGPQPPKRLTEDVHRFANEHPRATRAEWARFAVRASETAYQEGYMRGYEAMIRDPEQHFGELPPELEADVLEPDWRQSPPVRADDGFENPRGEVPEEFDPVPLAPEEDKEIDQQIEELHRKLQEAARVARHPKHR